MPMNLAKEMLAQAIGERIDDLTYCPVGGGSINKCFRLERKGKRYFCKINNSSRLSGMLEKEKNGLLLLASQKILRVPEVFICGAREDMQVLILEWIDQKPVETKCWHRLGEQLAALHQKTDDQFGLDEDNFIGSLTQSNQPTPSWAKFFIHQRLQPQLELAIEKKHLGLNEARKFECLYKELDDIFPQEAPSLIHGDLWAGNFMCTGQGEPLLFDPSVYFGHRSMDLAMTTLFGGFGKVFYESYHYFYPLPANYEEQWRIANLYPLLIHLNLFGLSYLGSIRDTIKSF